VLATLVVGIIILVSFVGYAFYSGNSSLKALSQQNSNLAQQVAVLQQRTVQVVTLTNTVVSVQTSTSTSTETDFITSTVLSTVTTTSNVYPPSSSSYPLTYISGNATWTNPSCGSDVVTVDVTYEMHTQISSNIIQWVRFPSGQLVQPTSQKEFVNQAYLTVYSEYDYTSGVCGGGQITSLNAFVTDTSNNQLSPSTYFIVQT
jgi:ribonucleotide reductase beta subunit family protein with ferritin-like domain